MIENFKTTNFDDQKHSNAIQRNQTDKILGIIETILTRSKRKLMSSRKCDQTDPRESEIGHVH